MHYIPCRGQSLTTGMTISFFYYKIHFPLQLVLTALRAFITFPLPPFPEKKKYILYTRVMQKLHHWLRKKGDSYNTKVYIYTSFFLSVQLQQGTRDTELHTHTLSCRHIFIGHALQTLQNCIFFLVWIIYIYLPNKSGVCIFTFTFSTLRLSHFTWKRKTLWKVTFCTHYSICFSFMGNRCKDPKKQLTLGFINNSIKSYKNILLLSTVVI